jgi:acyl-CoA reductase-like NAD-dependent aldehyde dehydrogenase
MTTEHFRTMVPGAKATGAVKEVHSPYDGTVVGSVDLSDLATVDTALATAHALFRDRSGWLAPAQRIGILGRAAALMEARAEELALEAAREGGKPLADSRVEVRRAVDGVRSCVDLLRTESGRAIPMDIDAASAGRVAFTEHEPIGVVVAVSAFNHPLNLIVHQVAPALAAGCPFIVKPSDDTPLSCFRFVAILHEAGLPPEWGQALLADREVSERLVTDPRVGFFSFVGSARVGWSLRGKLAPGTRCALEHGGAAPVIVAPDADLDRALPALVKGGFYHAGQVCVSVQRVYVHESIADDLGRRLAELAARLEVGDPARPETEVGPLIRAGEVERIASWVEEAAARGARVLTGGTHLSGNCYAPTVLYDPPDDCRVSREEVFGPVVCLYPYRDIADAIRRANALPWSFQAAVFTRDLDLARHACRHLDGSAVMVNDHTAFRVDWMPFAGLRQSGLGVGGIPYTFADMQIEKMCVIRS